MKFDSKGIDGGGNLEPKYTCDDVNLSPPLTITDVPKNAKSLAIIVYDESMPGGITTHWVVWNVPANDQNILEGKLPKDAVVGTNDFDNQEYDGPCPPENDEPHEYIFKLYALDKELKLDKTTKRGDLEEEIIEHIISEAEFSATYRRISPEIAAARRIVGSTS